MLAFLLAGVWYEQGIPSKNRRGCRVWGSTDHKDAVFPFLRLLFRACHVGSRIKGFEDLKFCGSDDGGVEGHFVGVIEAGACVVSVAPLCPPAPFRSHSRARGEGADNQAVEKGKKEDFLGECTRK